MTHQIARPKSASAPTCLVSLANFSSLSTCLASIHLPPPLAPAGERAGGRAALYPPSPPIRQRASTSSSLSPQERARMMVSPPPPTPYQASTPLSPTPYP